MGVLKSSKAAPCMVRQKKKNEHREGGQTREKKLGGWQIRGGSEFTKQKKSGKTNDKRTKSQCRKGRKKNSLENRVASKRTPT